jgi:transcription factor C subunit 3
MQSDFQERFAEAYENDQVPRIDYENLDAYDWEWVVNWAQNQLEIPTAHRLPNLPATREQFDSLFEIREEPLQTLDEIYQYNATTPIPRKQAMFVRVPFSIPLQKPTAEQRMESMDSERLSTAKTWVRANVIAAEESYKPLQARQALERLGEDIVSQAVQSLVTDRIISMTNRGRITPGRNYDVTENFLFTLTRKRAIEVTQLKRAEFFKTNILDTQLRSNGKYVVKYDAEDGDMLALINLVAEGRIAAWPVNPPKDKYGLTDGGYLTRLMDKGKLRFDIEVRAVPNRYVYGNPVEALISSRPPPRGSLDDEGPGKIPLWFDIHTNFVKLLWDFVVAAIVGCVAARPGIGARDIAHVLRHATYEWEIKLALEWMKDVGIVKAARDPPTDLDGRVVDQPGWVVKEWWWMAVKE